MLNRHFKHCHLLPIVLSVLLFGLPSQALAAQTVSVALPTFPITIGGIAIDNDHRQYPLLTYRNITYFPLTYHDTRFLGIESQWDDATQTLSIKRTDISGGYQSATQNNSKRYTATICTTPVMVNGKTIDYSKEPYPLLVFRDVTYFPLTWVYSVDEFGWQYEFDEKTGLSIATIYPQPIKIDLDGLKSLGDDTQPYYNIRLINDYCYYQGDDGIIYRISVDGSSKAEQVFQLPIWDYGFDGTRVSGWITEKDGKAVINFHQGGATMGHDESWLIADDGTSQQIPSPPPLTHIVQGFGFSVGHAAGPTNSYTDSYNGNLFLITNDKDVQPIGDGALHYFGDLVIIEPKVFVLASQGSQDNLYAIDLATNQTRRINDNTWQPDRLLSEISFPHSAHVYCTGGKKNEDGTWTDYGLYRFAEDVAELQATDITFFAPLCADKPLYAFSWGMLFYGNGTADEQKLYTLGQTEPINPHGNLVALSANDGDVIAVFADSDGQSDGRLMVFNPYGQVIFRSADVVQNAQMSRGRLFYLTPDGQGWLFPALFFKGESIYA